MHTDIAQSYAVRQAYYCAMSVHGLCVSHEHAPGSALTMAAVDTPVNAVLGFAHLSAFDTDIALRWTRGDT